MAGVSRERTEVVMRQWSLDCGWSFEKYPAPIQSSAEADMQRDAWHKVP